MTPGALSNTGFETSHLRVIKCVISPCNDKLLKELRVRHGAVQEQGGGGGHSGHGAAGGGLSLRGPAHW